ncbi:MAG: beta strand repeat-containing protein, partial [Gammaproteobacteria bacterium]
ANPGGGTLSGTTTVTAVAGVATFPDLSINKAGTGYNLVPSAIGLSGATSVSFNIAAAPASELAFATQPGNTPAGAPVAPAVRVTARDAQGNTATDFTSAVTIAIGNNPGAGILSGGTTVTAVAGVATFSTLSIDKVGTGYTLLAASAGLVSAPSTAFAITPGPVSAARSTLVATPTTLTASSGSSTATITVTARDAFGNAIADAPVTFAATGTGNTLSPTATTTSASGTATAAFSATVAGSKTISATVSGVAITQTATVTVAPAGATQLAFTAQPSSSVAGATLAPAVQVSVRDPFNNPVPSFSGNVTLSIATNPGGGTLAGIATVVAAGGVATFSTLSIDKSGTGYTLQATSGALTATTSTAFTITPGAATQLSFTAQPTNTTAGSSVTPAVQVTARDAQGNTVTGFTGNVTVSIEANPGGGTLAGTKQVAAVAGVATFSTLSIDKVGTGYTLLAASAGLVTASSAAFAITPGPVSASQSTLTATPPTLTASNGTSTATITVTARDALGNVIPGAPVSLAATGTGNTLSPAATTTSANGVATATLSATVAESKTISATVNGVAITQTATVTVAPAGASQLVLTGQPSSVVAGAILTLAVEVSARDPFNNLVPSFSGNVTVAIATNPGAGTLSGTTTVAAVAGVASFANLSIDKSGTGYTLQATSGTLTAGTSTAFTITPGAATRLVFTVPPTNTTAGASLTPAVQVAAQDALGNTATGFTGTVTVAIGTNPGSGTLSGTSTQAAVAGIASFANLSINKSGTGYTLEATS